MESHTALSGNKSGPEAKVLSVFVCWFRSSDTNVTFEQRRFKRFKLTNSETSICPISHGNITGRINPTVMILTFQI